MSPASEIDRRSALRLLGGLGTLGAAASGLSVATTGAGERADEGNGTGGGDAAADCASSDDETTARPGNRTEGTESVEESSEADEGDDGCPADGRATPSTDGRTSP